MDTGYHRVGVAANSSSNASSEGPIASTSQSTPQTTPTSKRTAETPPPPGYPRRDTPALAFLDSDSEEENEPPQYKRKNTDSMWDIAVKGLKYKKKTDQQMSSLEKQNEAIVKCLQELFEQNRKANHRTATMLLTISDKLDLVKFKCKYVFFCGGIFLL